MLEHKSYADRLTPFQTVPYMVRIWDRDVQDDGLLVLYYIGKAGCI